MRDEAMTFEVISRKEAREKGLRRYFTGIPCKHGHLDERVTANGTCIICNNLAVQKCHRKDRAANPSKYRTRARKWRTNNPDKARAQVRKWHANNPDKINAGQRRRIAANPEKYTAQRRQWLANNPEQRAKSRLKAAEWRKNNPEKARASVANAKFKRKLSNGRERAAEKGTLMDLSMALDIFKAQDNAFDYDADAITSSISSR